MFSKEVVKKQSWQSWCIFLYILKHNMQSKVGKVQIWVFYSRQSWQSWNITFLINWNNSDPRQSWQSWCIFLYIFKHNMQSKVGKVQIWIFYSRQSWQSWDKAFLIMDKYQTLGKVGKVGGAFGKIWLLLSIGKVEI